MMPIIGSSFPEPAHACSVTERAPERTWFLAVWECPDCQQRYVAHFRNQGVVENGQQLIREVPMWTPYDGPVHDVPAGVVVPPDRA